MITLRDGLVVGSVGNDGAGEGAGGDVDDKLMSQRPSPVVLRLPWKSKILFLETFMVVLVKRTVQPSSHN